MSNELQWSAVPSIKLVSLQPLHLEASGDVFGGRVCAVKAGMHRGRSASMVEADMPIGKEGLAELEKKLTMSQSRVHSNSDGENENNNSQGSGSLSVPYTYTYTCTSYFIFNMRIRIRICVFVGPRVGAAHARTDH